MAAKKKPPQRRRPRGHAVAGKLRKGRRLRTSVPALIPITGSTYDRSGRRLELRNDTTGERVTYGFATTAEGDAANAFCSLAQKFDPATGLVQYQVAGSATGAAVRPSEQHVTFAALLITPSVSIASWQTPGGGRVDRVMPSAASAQALGSQLASAQAAVAGTHRAIEEVSGATIRLAIVLTPV